MLFHMLSLANPSTSLCELRGGIPSRKRMFASSNISIAGQTRTAQREHAGVVVVREAAACSMWRLKAHNHNFGGFSKVTGRARLTTRATSPLIIPEPKPQSSETRCKHVIEDMNGWAVDELEPLLRPSHHARCWQPADMLPDASDPDFFDKVRALRQDAQHIPDSYFVVLVGDMITEEALPSYLNMLNITDGIGDESGADDTPWARWNRNWTAEENRHGDLLNKYLYLTGRVDMRRVEQTIQHLIGSGFDPDCDRNPYLLFAYTSFQERATKISHRNTSLLAREYGSRELAEMCGVIAADEARHESAYKRIVGELLRRDPDVTMMAFAEMMRRSIVMPAHLMDDDGEHERLNSHRAAPAGKLGRQSQLFADYAEVAQSIGVYTAEDYADITEHLIQHWDIEHACGLSGEGAEAQEYLMQLGPRMRRLAQVHSERRRRAAGRSTEPPSRAFSWVGGAHVQY